MYLRGLGLWLPQGGLRTHEPLFSFHHMCMCVILPGILLPHFTDQQVEVKGTVLFASDPAALPPALWARTLTSASPGGEEPATACKAVAQSQLQSPLPGLE